VSRVVVVDSSVGVKWFKGEAEEGVAEAFALLRRHREEAIVAAAPSLLRLEVLNALRSGGLDRAGLRAVAEALEAMHLDWHDADAGLSAHAAEIAVGHELTVYDAIFVALALRLDAELITADRCLTACTEGAVRLLGE